ncbi:MAG: CheR family methyltransferase [Myxococcota bacterium]
MSQVLSIERGSLEQLAALLLERAGLKITPDGYYGLRLALQARMPALGITDAAEYVSRLRQRAGEHELRSLIPLVTVGKTEFFRDTRQFQAFERTVFPQVLERGKAEGRPVKLWSAGCATGEEPYSLAMVALERGGTPESVEIWATDLNPAATESASRGQFPARRLVGISEERVQRFFVPIEGGYEVIPALHELIRFEGHNLAAPVWPQVSARSLDVIFCRNVIIYFDQPTIVGVMERFFESLRPGGWMFLGYSESLFKISTRFEMVEVGGTFAYQRPMSVSRRTPVPATQVSRPTPLTLPPVAPPQPQVRRSPTDVESVLRELKRREDARAAAAKAAQPAEAPVVPAPSAPPRPAVRLTPVERLAGVIAAIEKGDFPRALRTAHLLAEDEPEDLAARLTLGNVHALMGNLDEARDCFQQALSREPLCVEARLYLALAAMQVGRLDEAKQELTRALFLEPTLAVGHYLLGQVHERRNEPDAALRAYRNAISQRKQTWHELIGHFPDLPRSNEAIAQAAQYRLAALSEL